MRSRDGRFLDMGISTSERVSEATLEHGPGSSGLPDVPSTDWPSDDPGDDESESREQHYAGRDPADQPKPSSDHELTHDLRVCAHQHQQGHDRRSQYAIDYCAPE